MKRVVSVVTALLLGGPLGAILGPVPAHGGDEAKIDMVGIKLKDLLKQLEGQKGKVVVLDLWGFFCGPCKEEFPNLVRLHHTYAGKGVACMSLSLDFNDTLRKKALGFLREKKAVFKNYCLEEDLEVAGKHWDFEAIPVVVVYGRDGKIAKVFKNDDSSKAPFSYKEVEESVKKLIESK